MKKTSKKRIRWWQGTLLIIFGLVLTLLLLEAGMRLAGHIIIKQQEQANLRSLCRRGKTTILCLGESTTAGGYPLLLEEELNRRRGNQDFSVINAGISGTNTSSILKNLRKNILRYQPDIVITMMGINDPSSNILRNEIRGKPGWIEDLRIYKLALSLGHHIQVWLEGGSTDLEKLYQDRETPFASPPVSTPAPLNNRQQARIYLKEGRYQDATLTYEKVLKLHPDDATAARKVVECLRKSGKPHQALARAKKMLLRHPTHPRVALEYARCLALTGSPKEAAHRIEALVARLPQDGSICFELARLQIKLGHKQKAQAAAREGMKRDQSGGNGYCDELVTQANSALVAGKLQEAENLCRMALELIPEHDRALECLVDLCRRQSRQKEALCLLQDIMERSPDNKYIRAHLGSVLTDLEQFDQAEEILLESVAFNLKNGNKEVINRYGPCGFARLVTLYLKLEQYDRLKKVCLNILDDYPSSPRTLQVLALACENLNEQPAAHKYRQLAQSLASNQSNPVTKRNYQKLAAALRQEKIKLIAVQYPCRPLDELKIMLESEPGIVFVDNEASFKEAIKKEGVKEYFVDLFAGDFGHYTWKGGRLLARNIADVILPDKSPPSPND